MSGTGFTWSRAVVLLAVLIGCQPDRGLAPAESALARGVKAQVVGYTLTDITPPGAISGVATAVSDRGWTAGSADNANGTSYAWVRSSSGSYRMLGTLPGYPRAWAESVNNNGDVAGSLWTANGSASIAVFWPFNSPPVQIQVPGVYAVRAWALNDNQVVAGTAFTSLSVPFNFHAFTWTYNHQQGTDLGTLGGTDADALAINSSGDIAGWLELPSGLTRAFVKPAGQNVQQLVYGSTADGVAVGVTDQGVVMTTEASGGMVYIGIEWTSGYAIAEKWSSPGIQDINRYASALTWVGSQPAVHFSHGATIALPGWPSGSSTFAFELNAAEWVVGQGRNRIGQDRAILWRPY